MSTYNCKYSKRKFRMHKDTFNELCLKIVEQLGDIHSGWRKMSYLVNISWAVYNTRCEESGNHARLLASASYLDLLWSFGISCAKVYDCSHKAITWIRNLPFQFQLMALLMRDECNILNGSAMVSGLPMAFLQVALEQYMIQLFVYAAHI